MSALEAQLSNLDWTIDFANRATTFLLQIQWDRVARDDTPTEICVAGADCRTKLVPNWMTATLLVRFIQSSCTAIQSHLGHMWVPSKLQCYLSQIDMQAGLLGEFHFSLSPSKQKGLSWCPAETEHNFSFRVSWWFCVQYRCWSSKEAHRLEEHTALFIVARMGQAYSNMRPSTAVVNLYLEFITLLSDWDCSKVILRQYLYLIWCDEKFKQQLSSCIFTATQNACVA